MTSPLTVVPDIVAVVWLLAVCVITSDGVVWSLAEQAQPFVALAPVAPFMVITTVQVPVVPDVNFPAAAPPNVVLFEQPDAVNLVPELIT